MNGEDQPGLPPTGRKPLWAAFWFVFFTTPAAIISFPFLTEHLPRLNVLNDYGLIEASSSLLAGAFLAALILAKLRSETTAELIWRTLGWSFLFTIVFAIVSYAGCMIAGVG